MSNTEYILIKKAFLKTVKLTASMFPYQIIKSQIFLRTSPLKNTQRQLLLVGDLMLLLTTLTREAETWIPI